MNKETMDEIRRISKENRVQWYLVFYNYTKMKVRSLEILESSVKMSVSTGVQLESCIEMQTAFRTKKPKLKLIKSEEA